MSFMAAPGSILPAEFFPQQLTDPQPVDYFHHRNVRVDGVDLVNRVTVWLGGRERLHHRRTAAPLAVAP
jgi:hypothetical protein